MPKTYYNCHTHIFDFKCAPNKFIPLPIVNALSKSVIGNTLGKAITFFKPGRSTSKFARYANLLSIGLNKSQEDIFNLLQNEYDDWFDVKFVVLGMDMTNMGAGTVVKNVKQEMDELIELKKKYPDKLLPFIPMDPRSFRTDIELLNLFTDYWKTGAFNGIKLYPATGFYPDNPKLFKLYDFAIQYGIPIMSHCTQGPTHYNGKLPDKQFDHPFLMSAGLFNITTNPKEFQRNFTQPILYDNLLNQARFKDLKVCLAHYGGASKIAEHYANPTAKNNWYATIRHMLQKHTNLYTDLAYTLFDEGIYKHLKDDMDDIAIAEKILFGTDFYVVSVEMSEQKVKNKFRSFLDNRALFDKIAYENPKKYLTTTSNGNYPYYTAP